MPQELILVINPGNTSTKVAVYDGLTPLFVESIKHSDEELSRFADINAQKDFREGLIYDFMKKKAIDPATLRAIAARGGLLKPLASGTYVVDQRMVADLVEARKGSHASNLAAQIGYSMAAKLGIACYIVDPVSVDEAEPLARYSGHRLFTRVMLTHALNMKAVAKRFCGEKGLRYDSVTLLVIHLGTGNSISLHRNGRMVDAVNPSEEGAFSMDRSGGLPILPVIERPDRMAKSFTYPGSMKDGFDEALRVEEISFYSQDGGFYVTLPEAKIERYVELVRGFLAPGGWSEVVGMRWAFIFSDAILEWDSVEAEAEILKRVKEHQPAVRFARTVMEMVWVV